MPQDKKNQNEELKILIPDKTIKLEIGEVTLKPFKFKHINAAIDIINKYFFHFVEVRENYQGKRTEILDKYSEETVRAEALNALDETFDVGIEIARSILSKASETVAEDLKKLVQISSTTEVDLDDLTWGECLVLLGTVIGLNMDFFAKNSQMMNLGQVVEQKPEQPKSKKATEKSLVA